MSLFHGIEDSRMTTRLVKRVFFTLDLLIIFVTLACEDNNVAGCAFSMHQRMASRRSGISRYLPSVFARPDLDVR